MRLIFVFILAVSLRIGNCKEEDLNEVTSKPGALDSSLRKALLKALTELENEERNSNNFNYHDDKTIEKARASAVSIYTRGPDISTTTESGRERQIVVIQKSNGLQHRPITSFQPSHKNFTNTEQFLASASSSHVPEQKNYITKKPTSNLNSLSNNFVFNGRKSATPKTDFTSPSPTIASPTTEESDAKVEDVQFFSAPLVAAFTVHQDARGLPKSVEPIYKQSEQVPIVTKFLSEQTSQDSYTQDLLKREQFRNQIVLHEKQRALEEQLYKIQQQQNQQQDFLLQQQELLQEQQKRLLDERTRIQHNDQPFVPITNPPQNIVSQQSYNTLNEQPNTFNTENQFPTSHLQNPRNGALVSFQSSVSLNPAEQLNKAGELPFNAQHLPIKNAIDFRQSPYIQMSTYNHIQSVLTPPPNGFHHFNYAQNIDVAPLGQQSNRVYRKEPVTGNFVNNDYQVQPNRHLNYYNNVAIQPSVQLSNVRLLRNNGENYHVLPGFPVQQPIVNQHLNNLLYTSGISKGGENFFNGPRLYHGINRSDKKVSFKQNEDF